MNKRIPILLGLILVIAAMWLLLTSNRTVNSLIDRLDHLGYDLELQAQVLTKKPSSLSRIVIIDIDDKSLQKEGQWPWPRSKLALLVDKLTAAGAAEIIFDVFFAEKQNNLSEMVLQELNQKKLLNSSLEKALQKTIPFFDDDKILAQSLANNQSILSISFLPIELVQNSLPPPLFSLTPEEQTELQLIKALGYIANIPILQQAAKGTGFINILPDNDGVIRRAPMIIEYAGNIYPALSLQAVMIFLGQKISLVTPVYGNTKHLEGIQLGERIIPTDALGQVLIPYIGRSFTFPFYSATDVLRDKLPKEFLLGKIILIGTSATGLTDLRATPVQNLFPGVEVQATLINAILDNNFYYIPAWTFGANITLTFLLGLLAAIIFPYLGPRSLGTITFVFPLTLFGINHLLWVSTGFALSWLVLVALIIALAALNIIYGYLFETRRREKLKNMFGQYLSTKHIDEMLKSDNNYGLHGEDRDMSVLFADIRNFTTMSEGMSATELVEMLNTFFTPMTEIIFNHRGTIDKYVGDLIMAFWGAPLKDKRHAYHAIESALAMREKVKVLQPILSEHNWPVISIGIGINSGMMSVGDMGSSYRRNYTVIGDAVNLASRIEGLTKFYGVDIIVTEFTQHNQPHFVFRLLDKVTVKGKKASINIYEVVAKTANLTEELKQELAEYHTTLDLYFLQQWEIVEDAFQKLQEKYSNKKIYSLYVKRIQAYKLNPPPADWDGVYKHEEK